jgi:hypothetical protein
MSPFGLSNYRPSPFPRPSDTIRAMLKRTMGQSIQVPINDPSWLEDRSANTLRFSGPELVSIVESNCLEFETGPGNEWAADAFSAPNKKREVRCRALAGHVDRGVEFLHGNTLIYRAKLTRVDRIEHRGKLDQGQLREELELVWDAETLANIL